MTKQEHIAARKTARMFHRLAQTSFWIVLILAISVSIVAGR